MNDHPREITLELFVLGSETLNDADRDAIQSHLDRCAGCRALTGSIDLFYRDLGTELGNFNDNLPVPSPDDLPVRARQSLGRYEARPGPVREVDPRFPFRAARWIVRHPALASAGTFAGVAAAAAIIMLAVPRPESAPRDLNPVDLRTQGMMLQATNRYGEQVGEIEVNREVGLSFRNDPVNFGLITGLVDVDGDGNNELIWAERWAGDQKVAQRVHCVALNPVRTLWTHEVRRELEYLYKTGANTIEYSISQVRMGDFDRNGRPEVYVVLTSGSFSNQLLKLDAADGKEIGSYVHTGGLSVLEFLDVDGDSIPEILLGGTNNSWSEATIAIIDPRHVDGQSVHSEPYALRNSVPANEKAYIRIPQTMVARLNPRNTRNVVEAILPNPQNNVVRVGVRDDTQQRGVSIAYYLTLGPDLSVLGAERGDEYALVADSLFRTGKLPRPADREYFQEHVGRISWWDGEKWVHTPAWNKKALLRKRPA